MRLIVDRPHNDLLQQAVSTGFLGLAACVWLWVAIFRAGWRISCIERAEGSAMRFSARLLGGAVAYFCQLQFSNSYISVAPVFWTLVGLLAVYEGASQRRGRFGSLKQPAEWYKK